MSRTRWRGKISVAGRGGFYAVEGGGWVAAWTPIEGLPTELLRRQAEVCHPVRVAGGPVLWADLPFQDEPGATVAVLREALAGGVAALESGAAAAPQAADPATAARALEDYCEANGVECRRENGTYRLRPAGAEFHQHLDVDVTGGCLLFRGDLVRFRALDPACGQALAHFLLALHGRLRLARASLLEDRVRLEAVLPGADLDVWRIGKALGALNTGARLARRECAALLDPPAATRYLEFFELGGEL